MDPALQKHSLPHFSSFTRETPIKPSQVPNLLSHPPQRRLLPPQTPDECSVDMLSPQRYPAGIKYPSPFIPNSSTNIDSLIKDRLDGLKHVPPTNGHVLSPVNSVSTARENLAPQHNVMHSGPGYISSSQPGKTLGNHLPSCHFRSDQEAETKIPSSNSRKNNDVSQRQEPNK
ncbi:hypothetical protein AMECASPLE_034440, partial [Ameca splendens]